MSDLIEQLEQQARYEGASSLIGGSSSSIADLMREAAAALRKYRAVFEAADKYVSAKELELGYQEIDRRYGALFDALEAIAEVEGDG